MYIHTFSFLFYLCHTLIYFVYLLLYFNQAASQEKQYWCMFSSIEAMMWKIEKQNKLPSGGLEYLEVVLTSMSAQELSQWDHHLAVKDMLDNHTRFAT